MMGRGAKRAGRAWAIATIAKMSHISLDEKKVSKLKETSPLNIDMDQGGSLAAATMLGARGDSRKGYSSLQNRTDSLEKWHSTRVCVKRKLPMAIQETSPRL
jgi:hypothetical protein